jgi:type IV secretion system protein VirD4
MKKSKKGSTIFTAIASLLIFYLCNRVALVYENIPTGNFLEKTNEAIDMIIPAITAQPFVIGLTKAPLVSGAIGVVLIWLIYLYAIFGAKNYMFGVEHGSATWGTPQDIANYVDKDADNNILFTETEKLSMSDRMKRTETDDFNRNKNVLIIGGSGSGKTRFYIKPNLMQLHSSYVITDPKGSLIHETGKMLSDAGYKIKVFDLINRDKSDLYNPFEYIKNEDDILKLINNLMANTNAPQSKSAGDFWEKSEVALLEAIFGYIFFVFPRKEDKTIANAMEMLRLAEVKEDNEEYQSPLDIMFAELKEKDPDHFAVRQYDIYKFAPDKTAKSILISVGVRLAAFNIPSIRRIVSGDTIGLDMIGSEKTALFIILPDTDKSFNFLAAMMFQHTLLLNKPEDNKDIFKRERPAQEVYGKCPKCSANVIQITAKKSHKNYYVCEKDKTECGFILDETVAGRKLTKAQVKKLLEKGKTDLISGFTSKAGKSFNAYLVLKDDFTPGFEFEKK